VVEVVEVEGVVEVEVVVAVRHLSVRGAVAAVLVVGVVLGGVLGLVGLVVHLNYTHFHLMSLIIH
jgi:hypothetical protein